jgi:hypothetical protein
MATLGGRSYTVCEDTLSKAADLLEILANLNYLACMEAHNPNAVKHWTNEAHVSITGLALLIQEIASTHPGPRHN